MNEQEQFRAETIEDWAVRYGYTTEQATAEFDSIMAFIDGRQDIEPAPYEPDIEEEQEEEQSHESKLLELLEEMPSAKRKVYFIQQSVTSEQAWLEELLRWWKQDRSVSLTEIREQRKRVQAWTKRLREAKEQYDTQS